MSKFKKKASDTKFDNMESKPFLAEGDEDIIAVLDGDELAFKIAAAVEKRGIRVTNNLNQAEILLNNRTELKKVLHGLEVPEEFFAIEDTQIAEPIQNALNTLRNRVKIQAEKCDAGHIEIYMSGEGNFRDSLPLPVKYKGQRSDTIKPLLLKDLREYLIKYRAAVVVDGREADDALTSRMNDGYVSGEKIVGVTQDKDATATEGWYLHPDKMDKPVLIKGLGKLWIDTKGANDVVRGIGRKFLYHQVLIGDKVDYYNPRDLFDQWEDKKKPRFGEKSSFKILDECTTDKECVKAILDQYIKWFGEGDITYTCWEGKEHTVDVIDLIQLYWDCAYMQKFEGDRTDVRELLTDWGLINNEK